MALPPFDHPGGIGATDVSAASRPLRCDQKPVVSEQVEQLFPRVPNSRRRRNSSAPAVGIDRPVQHLDIVPGVGPIASALKDGIDRSHVVTMLMLRTRASTACDRLGMAEPQHLFGFLGNRPQSP